ncbi:recombinase family protein [Streptomyces sp. NPDC018833]|uniref:recombinase family protein n=1 Tax=Streptomyces sp. NPDC018833 TaxID=3365053 RepID=UPI0037BBC437
MTRYVALYCRLSPRPDGSYEGVDLQERWGRSYAGSLWPTLPVKVFADAGISAANGDHRPRYEDFRTALARGEVAHVWAVEQSRLERREVEWFTLAAELDAAGISELHTNRDGVVRVHDEVAGIRAVLNAGEVRKMKKRVNDRLAENAAQGRAAGSKPFGYGHGVDESGNKTYVIIPEQADAIRWAADKVLNGWSLANIAAELRSRGLVGAHKVKVKDANGEIVTDASGNPVTRPSTLRAGSVRSMVTKPTIAGFRVHQGVIVGRGNWAPILDEATWQACRAKLSAPRTVSTSDGFTYPVSEAHKGNPAGRKYTLTGGLAVCGVCNKPMVGSMKKLKNGKRTPYLLCHPNRGGKGCTGIMLEATEKYVTDALFAELEKPEFQDVLTSDDHGARRDELTAELTAVEAERNEIAVERGRGELTLSEWKSMRAGLNEREGRLRAELAAVPPPAMQMNIKAIKATRKAWDGGLTLDEKRAFLRRFIDCVTIKRAKPGTKGFDHNRVAIEWRP